ncbi:MAG: aminopeptidase [Candidatus Hydrothermarchaeales archaeon]
MLKDILSTCLGIAQGETVLVVTDADMLGVAGELEMAAKELSNEVITMRMKPRSRHAEEPPLAVARAMEASDVVLIPTSKSLSHTDARKQACDKGARIASMPGITMSMLKSGGLTADYNSVKKMSEEVAGMLTQVAEIRIKSEQGMDFKASIKGRRGLADTGIFIEKGAFGNLPAGEGFIAPLEGESKGTVVFDGSFGRTGVLREPIRFYVENGRVTKSDSQELKEYLKYENADNIAEIGIGTNPKAMIIGNILEDEKVLGTAHVALGDNHTFGGLSKAEVHLDGIIRKPSIWLDERQIMQKGRLLI